jgi:hypothetical protein
MAEQDWEKVEERFANLVRLGGDPRTPDHERDNACRAAVAMFVDGKMTVTATGRWDALIARIRSLMGAMPPQAHAPGHGCLAPFNLNGTNGWKCCRCGSFNTSLVVQFIGTRWLRHRCTMCGHERCDDVHLDPHWDPKRDPDQSGGLGFQAGCSRYGRPWR